MEYLPRGSLRPFVGRLGQPQAFGVIEGVLAGLGHAERRGIAHRDLKPENVLVTNGGGVKIADFGIAKAYTSATGNFTAAGVAVGTPAYMAPEQAWSRGVGPFTDLYALGVMAYELLGGAPPFDGDGSPMAVMYRHVSEAPPPLAGVDPRLAAWVARMLEKRPEARPAGALAGVGRARGGGRRHLRPVLAPSRCSWRGRRTVRRRYDDGGTTRPDHPAAAGPHPRAGAAAPPVARAAGRGRGARARRRGGVRGVERRRSASVGAAGRELDADDGLGPDRRAVRLRRRPGRDRGGRITDAGRRGAGIVVLPQLERRLAPSRPRAGLDFGAALASAELNRDQFADLVVGAPGANTGARSQREGAIYVFSGTRDGLRRAKPLVRPWRRDGDGYRSARFGAALAAGDLNGDGYADLAVGTPGSDAAPPDEAGLGSIVLIFGDEKGLSRTRVHTIPRPTGSSGGFGSVLAIADVTRDGRPDLLEGAPGPEGHATFCKGTKRGPRTCRVMEGADPGPAAITAGDVTGDGSADIVHGVPDAGLATDTGAVRVWPGGRGDPASVPIEITQESPDIQGTDEPGDRFGASVAVGTIDRDRFADIVVGTPGNNDGTGRVALLFGAGDGTDETRDVGYSEATPGPLRALTLGSRFGSSLALLHLDRDRRLDLVVTAAGDRRFVRMSAAGGTLDANSATLLNLPGIETHVGAH